MAARDVINDPLRLLELTVKHTNGFFTHIYEDHLHTLPDNVLQQLAAHLGDAVTFALIDDRDVGSLYEQSILALHNLNESRTWKNKVPAPFTVQIPNLQQHYTPMAIAERMLAALPLERLRPEERVIFDPAAGSGTLLLAATKRLAVMPDIQLLHADERRMLLAHHVMGNDIDPNAARITQLRYALVQETLNATFPSPEHFTKQDYEDYTAWPSSPRPRVLVANPPFQEKGAEQHAVTFLNTSLQHLQTGDQFAFVLPQSFLQATTHGWSQVRTSLAERAHILETWQLPEGVIGLESEQATCVISGVIEAHKPHFVIALAIFSRAHKDVVQRQGFLGQAWVFPLPTTIDRTIIAIVAEIIEMQKQDATDDDIAPLRERLNELVEASYGHPVVPLTLTRTGKLPDMDEWQRERDEPPMAVTGMVLDVDAAKNQILLYLEGLLDDETEAWVPLPPELPGWALDGTVFDADISESVETFADLRMRPWALRNIQHTPRPYLSLSDLQEKLSERM